MAKWTFFGSIRFAFFVKSLKTVRFLERYKILTENGNKLCTVRFALFSEKAENGRLFGAVKNRNGNGVFSNGAINVFLQKAENGMVLGYGAAVY